MRFAIFVILLFIISGFVQAQATDLKTFEKADQAGLQEKIENDLAAVQRYRNGMRAVLAFVATKPELFPLKKQANPRLLSSEQKELVRLTWKTFLDYNMALDSLKQYYRRFDVLKKESRKSSFLIAYSAFLAQYRFAMEWIQVMDRNNQFEIVLNEPVPEFGLPKETYSAVKFKILNVAQATEFAALEAVYKFYGGTDFPEVRAQIKEDRAYIWNAGKYRGQILTAKNGLLILKKTGFSAWFPVQTGVSEWMGDTKVYRVHQSLISEQQVQKMIPLLHPGDILLIRHEWYLSNVGLPGFWPHGALYIGTPAERENFFNDPEVKTWVKESGQVDGNFNALLQMKYPQAYEDCLKPVHRNKGRRILEAISEGVVFTALEQAVEADSVVILRPRLTKKEKAVALLRAFHYAGRPYDFNFDFLTDSALVCTELLYKAYEPSAGYKGLKFPLVEILGRQATPANEIARMFDEQYGTPEQQLDFVLFLDGYEKQKKAVEANLADFRQSWKRPKWHVVVQKSAGE
ncbi:MAG: hypothetical protein EHM45_01290 [Desulfobacteraceae bacterium]|nr:MAG: hypothetical protein EHM45_01290 [Desulfobacteraceae bacterium]